MTAGRDGTVTLPDGRRLGYAAWGAPGDPAVLSFHGGGTCRLMVIGGDDRAAAAGLRVVGTDLPGFGLSDPRPGRTTTDWPADVAALADHLGIDRCAVVGVSAGGRYALACGAAAGPGGVLAGRVVTAGVVAGALDPAWYPDDELVALAARDLGAARAEVRRAAAGIAADVDAHVAALATRPGPDGPINGRPEVRARWAATLREAFRQGIDGPVDEMLLTNRPWGFALAEVAVPVRWWHGELDPLTPPDRVRRALAAVPAAELTVVPGAGHDVGVDHAGAVLAALAADLAG